MTSYVLMSRAKPQHLLVKALVQTPDGKGGWTTVRVHELDGDMCVEQVHGGQRIIIEEIDPRDYRLPPQRLQPRASAAHAEGAGE